LADVLRFAESSGLVAEKYIGIILRFLRKEGPQEKLPELDRQYAGGERFAARRKMARVPVASSASAVLSGAVNRPMSAV
jgi:hypothetical protein